MKALDAFKTMKKFTPTFCKQHKKDFPDMAKVRCHCHKQHSPHCGGLTPKYLVQAHKNFNCCLKQPGKSAASFALCMQTLEKYHARDDRKCTCGECGEDETKCDREPYHSLVHFHALVYEIECTTRASQTKQLVDPNYFGSFS